MGQVSAHAVKGLRAANPADDGKYGLLGFERERPDSAGSNELWLAVPIGALPGVAIGAINALPQPQSAGAPAPVVFDVEVVQFSRGPLDELVLTLEFREGLGISVKLSEHQSTELAAGIQGVVERMRSDAEQSRKH